MAAYRRVYDSGHLQADCQEPGSAPEPYRLGNRVWVGTNLIHGEKCVISRDVSENQPGFTENSRKEFQKFTENSRVPQTLYRGVMLMQTKKSVE